MRTRMKFLLTFIANLKKIRQWGLRGVLSYVGKYSHNMRLRRVIRESQCGKRPMRGITLIGNFTLFGSASKVMRDFATSLKDANVPYQTFDTAPNLDFPLCDIKDILTPQSEFCIDKYDHIVGILPSIVPSEIKIPQSRIAFWEFEDGFLHAYPDMPLERQTIAMSDFNYRYFTSILPNVIKILYPFNFGDSTPQPKDEVRRKYGIANNGFIVLFNFDYGAGFNRKNPDGAMLAFAKAFRDTSNAWLVFKSKSASDHPDRAHELKRLASELGISDRFLEISAHIPFMDVIGLTNACDVYLSLHRGEGFGITLAEAMAMGKPVVCTNWSSTTEFCKPECSIPIPFKMISVQPEQIDHPYYQKVKEWAEPDVDAAATALRRLYEDPRLRDELGRKAAASIKEQFSVLNFKKSVDAFLDL